MFNSKLNNFLSMPNNISQLPVYSLSQIESSVQVRRIEYKNPYDFTREHRHDYFELFFFESGGGSQLIDFHEYPVLENSSYIVFPQQIHLLKRAPEAKGVLIQFREEIIPSAHIRMLLQQTAYGEKAAIFFEKDSGKLLHSGSIVKLIQDAAEKQTDISRNICLHYLQALLLQLLEFSAKAPSLTLSEDRQLLFDYRQLIDIQHCYNHSVTKYATYLNTTEKKLSATTKKYLGLSPLQVIHNRLLLEAKRRLLFETTSHKEIAFHLGFDSPASFSLFIKNKTGFNPSELNKELVKIHK
jgi:AraC family transcriptional activator of pobA